MITQILTYLYEEDYRSKGNDFKAKEQGGFKMKLNVGTEEAIKRWDRFADTYSANHTEQGDLHKEVF